MPKKPQKIATEIAILRREVKEFKLLISNQKESLDIKNRANLLLSVELDRLKDELFFEQEKKENLISQMERFKEATKIQYEGIFLTESRCAKKSLHIKVLYIVIAIMLSCLIWS